MNLKTINTSRSFDEWLRAVDRRLQLLCGLTSNGLPDWGYHDAYEDGMTPGAAAERVLRAAGDF